MMAEETVVISRSEYEELKSENARLAQALIHLQEQIHWQTSSALVDPASIANTPWRGRTA